MRTTPPVTSPTAAPAPAGPAPAGPAEERRPWRDLPRSTVVPLGRLLEGVVGQLLEMIPREVPQLVEDDITSTVEDDLAQAVDLGVRRFVDLVGRDEPALGPEAERFFTDIGSSEAANGVALTNSLDAHRTAHRLVVSAILEHEDELGLDRRDLIGLSESVFTFIDELCAATARGYAQQMSVQAGAIDLRRRNLAHLLTSGADRPRIEAAARAAGWTVPERVRAVVIPLADVHDVLAELGPTVVHHERESTSVLVVPDSPDGRRRLRSSLAGHRAACGPAVPLERAGHSLELADAVAALGLPTSDDGGDAPVFAEDRLTDVLLSSHPAALDELRRRVLAPLDATRSTTREKLLDTLAVWLHHWGQRAHVADILGVHPQTIGYRLTQLRGLFGDTLDDAETRFALAVALHERLQLIEPEDAAATVGA